MDKITVIHEITKCGQMFKSYSQLLQNQSFNIDRKKLSEILQKCAKHCLELRNMNIEEENNV